jgi:hypothetical protein
MLSNVIWPYYVVARKMTAEKLQKLPTPQNLKAWPAKLPEKRAADM